MCTNNHSSFQTLKVSKYYDHDFLQNFILLSTYLLPAPLVKKSHILAEIYFIFQKKRPRLDLKGFEDQIWTLKNDQKNSYQVRQILAIFCRLVARRVTKIVK